MIIYLSTEISYPQTFSVIFDESVELIFVNNNIIFLDNKKGIAVNGGGITEDYNFMKMNQKQLRK